VRPTLLPCSTVLQLGRLLRTCGGRHFGVRISGWVKVCCTAYVGRIAAGHTLPLPLLPVLPWTWVSRLYIVPTRRAETRDALYRFVRWTPSPSPPPPPYHHYLRYLLLALPLPPATHTYNCCLPFNAFLLQRRDMVRCKPGTVSCCCILTRCGAANYAVVWTFNGAPLALRWCSTGWRRLRFAAAKRRQRRARTAYRCAHPAARPRTTLPRLRAASCASPVLHPFPYLHTPASAPCLS